MANPTTIGDLIKHLQQFDASLPFEIVGKDKNDMLDEGHHYELTEISFNLENESVDFVFHGEDN